MLAKTLLLLIVDYTDTIYVNLNQEQLNKLECLESLCIRFIFGLRKYDHVSELRKKVKWLPIRIRRKSHILSRLYSVLFNSFLPKKRFEFLHYTHKILRLYNDNLNLKIPSHSSSSSSKSFTIEPCCLRNSMPLSKKGSNIIMF